MYTALLILSFPSVGPFLVRTLNENVPREQEIQQYVKYFAKPTVTSALKRYLHQPKKLFRLSKAAEVAVDSYSKQSHRTYRLRRVIALEELQNDTSFRYHVLVSDENSALGEATFDVVVVQRALRVAEFVVSDFKDLTQFKTSGDRTEEKCDELSKRANCSKCSFRGICDKGTAHISPWLAFALKTQRELQVDVPFNQVQTISAHNAFNDRSDGYGVIDDCPWPPPYSHWCLDLANQEFSFTDLLDMGVRGLEIDPWWCFDKMLMSHDDNKPYQGCAPWDRHFEDGIKEIAEWVHRPENAHEIIRLYFEDGANHTFGHDDLINGPVANYLGDKVFTPYESKTYFPGRWPTPRELRKLNKTVIIAAFGDQHGGTFIFDRYWHELTRNEFESKPNCTAIQQGVPSRVYCDSTEYVFFWNGPKETGVILDFSKFMKCGVTYPAADQVNPTLLGTAVFTWAEGEPSKPLTDASCVVLNGHTHRWYLAHCQDRHPFACQSTRSANVWLISSAAAEHGKAVCPDQFRFSVPHNGLQHQQLVDIMRGTDVWLNFTPYIPLVV